MAVSTRLGTLIALIVLAGGCSTAGQQAGGEASPPPSAEVSAPGTPAQITCPNPHGGSCLGALAAGTYTTKNFQPTLTYTVPDGWGNFEDLDGNFLLLPPGATLEGGDAGTDDYIGIYSSVAAVQGCGSGSAPGVGHTPADIAAHLTANREALKVSAPQAATVGGLQGLVLDLELQTGFTDGCDLLAPAFQ